ncbi:hypothetical protein FGO68_gene57 [Halteria grandinella]|uniref:Uncharacterized protein n=1 Tax=Halteria grandinella TaxID=5974 RepID=A0A8J8N995_HALGN|nr:hypothetical protein FGO68_gene57 [Halteria grandinella]
MMQAREIPKLSPKRPNKNGAPAIATPAANEARPIAKSGRPSLKPIKRIEESANCIEMPSPTTKRHSKDKTMLCDNQKPRNPRNCKAIIASN